MNRYMFAALLIVTTALMGSSFVVGKIGVAHISPLLLAGLRFVLAGGLMAIFVVKYEHPRCLIDWGKIAVIGLFQTVGVMGCIFVSLRTITAGESSILTFMNPLFVVLLSSLWLKTTYRALQWAGVGIGALGMVVLGLSQWSSGTAIGLMGGISWAVATLLVKRFGSFCSIWVLTAYQMLFGGLVLTGSSLLVEDIKLSIHVVSVTSLLYLAIIGSIVQFALWFYLLSQGDPARTSAYLFLAPLFGVLCGYLLLDEPIHAETAVGAVLVGMSIYWINRGAPARPR
ncbi:DMT family transporter [Paenibacillus sp. YYML68]|uniref:DMT family transporter n=1 Tax=Paenibacillus sp. YYML68 TaxID=2909250 RepID=UPI002490DE4A|nr:EamA family transporter [Paenibacillus sp. YYML68]